MAKYLLSICIPTYNQPAAVGRLLQGIAPQISPEVEVVIQDDSPNEDTRKIVYAYKKQIPIRYFGRQDAGSSKLKKGEKGGLDRSILFLTREACGKYVWWFGDDLVTDKAIGAVLDALRQHPSIDFLFVNYVSGYNRDTVGINLPHDRFFRDRNEVLLLGQGSLGFITATVFRREKALTGISGAEAYIGSAFVNLYLILHVLSQDGPAYFLRGPYVINYPNQPEEVNEDGFEVFGINFLVIVKHFESFFDRASVRRLLRLNFGHVWKGVLVRWVTGYESPRGKRWPMFKYYWSYPEFWIAFPLMLLPLSFNKFLYKIYLCVIKNKFYS